MALQSKTPPRRIAPTPLSEMEVRSFDFFALPRELRDEIYKNVLIPDLRRTVCRQSRPWARNVAPKGLLTLSRQFTSELLEIASKSACIIASCDTRTGLCYQRGTKYISQIEIHSILTCFYPQFTFIDHKCRVAARWLRGTRGRLESLVANALQEPRSVVINVYARLCGLGEPCMLAKAESYATFTTIEGFTSMNVYETKSDNHEWVDVEDRRMIMIYDKEERRLVHVG